MAQKNSLGKGLGAILSVAVDDLNTRASFIMCGIEELYPNPFQPRKNFDDEAQKQLVASLKKSGLIQPIVVRKTDKGYEIIAGERRWRAAQAGGLRDVPIIIREAADQEVAELSLVENVQREELNAVEEAHAYQTLTDQFGLSQEEISARVGKDRSTIANTLRLLKLPEAVQAAVIEKKITPGHARSLLTLHEADQQLELMTLIVRKGLNVRETERLVKTQMSAPVKKAVPARFSHITELEKSLAARMLTKVRIRYSNKRGAIEIVFSGDEELNRLINLLM
ncbi:MAG: ParB/RepB/Spo0J family partition protein [Syntrophales bacterium]